MPKPKATTAPDGPKIKLSGTPQLVEDDTVKLPGLGDNAIFVVTGYIRKRTEDCPEDGKPETEVLMATMKQLAVVPPRRGPRSSRSTASRSTSTTPATRTARPTPATRSDLSAHRAPATVWGSPRGRVARTTACVRPGRFSFPAPSAAVVPGHGTSRSAGRTLMDAMSSIWAVTGHRPQKLSPATLEWARGELERVVHRAVAEFGMTLGATGLALGPDTWFAEACLVEAVPFEAYVPHARQASKWSHAEQARWGELCLLATALHVAWTPPVDEPGMDAPTSTYFARNVRLVDRAEWLIAVYDGREKGGTAHAVGEARKRGLSIVTIDPETRSTKAVRGTRSAAQTEGPR